jgi:hypothetical protein
MVEGDRAGILRQAHVGSHEHIMYDLFHIVGGNSSAYDTGDVRLISNNEVRIEVRLALKNQPKQFPVVPVRRSVSLGLVGHRQAFLRGGKCNRLSRCAS